MDRTKNKKLIHLFLKNPGRIGSVTASSPFLGKKIAQKIDFSKAKCIVEFGAGTEALPRKSWRLCRAIASFFASKLSRNWSKE